MPFIYGARVLYTHRNLVLERDQYASSVNQQKAIYSQAKYIQQYKDETTFHRRRKSNF